MFPFVRLWKGNQTSILDRIERIRSLRTGHLNLSIVSEGAILKLSVVDEIEELKQG